MSRKRFAVMGLFVILSSIVALIGVFNGFITLHSAHASPPLPDKFSNFPLIGKSGKPHIMRTRQTISHNTSSSATPLVYQNGRVIQNGSTIYAIFWEPPTLQDGTSTYISTNYNNLIERYFQDVGKSKLYNNNTQYYDNFTGHILNKSSLGGVWIDNTQYVPSDCSYPSNLHGCMVDHDIQDEVLIAMKLNHWIGGLNHIFFVYTSYGEDIYSPSNNLYAFSGFCGYHNYFSSSSQSSTAVLYAQIPYEGTDLPNCGVKQSPNNDFDADSSISTTSHEQMESVTDPLPHSGWYDQYDTNGGEIGDKCAWQFGTLNSSGGDVLWNNHPYIVQKEWSNFKKADGSMTGCTLNGNNGQLMIGSAYVNTGNGITAYNTSDGMQRWSYTNGLSGVAPIGNPTQAAGKIFFVDQNANNLQSINASTGLSTGITYALSGVGSVSISTVAPYVSGGTLYVGAYDSTYSYLEAFNPSCSPVSPAPLTCSAIWKVTLSISLAFTPTVANNVLYVPESSTVIQAFDLTQNPPALLWTLDFRNYSGKFGNSISTPITVDNSGNIYYGDAGFYGSGSVRAVQPVNTGGTWTFTLLGISPNSGLSTAAPTLSTDGTILYYAYKPCPSCGTGTRVDAFYTANGNPVTGWTQISLPDMYSGSPIVIAGTAMYFGTQNGAYSYNTSSGFQNWYKLSGSPLNQLFNSNANTFFAGSGGAYDLADGNGRTRAILTSSASSGMSYSLKGY